LSGESVRNTFANTDCDADAYGYSDANGYAYAYAYPDKAVSDATAAPDTASASHALARS
jgi:hypothetical protein